MSEEQVLYEYSPTLGGIRLCSHPRVDRRILAAHQSGATITIKIEVTNFRLLVHLGSNSVSQTLPVAYDDLTAIVASSGWLDPNYGVTVHDKSGQLFNVGPSRPHVVALDLWVGICGALITTMGPRGLIRDAVSLISSYDISTLLVPDDYYSLRQQSLDLLLQGGFSFPINSCPRIDPGILISEVDASFQSQQRSQHMSSSTTTDLKRPSPLPGNSSYVIYVPAVSIGGGLYNLKAWLVADGTYTSQGQPLVRIWIDDNRGDVVLKANNSGIVHHSKKPGDDLKVGGIIGSIVSCEDPASAYNQAMSGTNSDLAPSLDSCTTSDAIKQGTLQVVSGSTPQFRPSLACEPAGFKPMETAEADLKYALANSQASFQSFCSDLDVITSSGIDDDVVSIASFDEALYCALVREMHRYSLAEIADNQSDLAKENASLGAMVGSLLGLISGNIFAPFLGHSYGKNISDRGRKLEEFLPDPNLLFYQDENSYLSWSKAQVVSPRLRRLILERRVKPDGNVFFRILPAIVTADSVFPIQLFKLDSSTYFYRPLPAGIERNQANYDTIKVQRRYFHLRGEGVATETETVVPIFGRDVEGHQGRIYRYADTSLEYFYVDFKIHPGRVF